MSRTEPSFAERVCLLDTPWASGTRRRSHERRRTARPAVDPRHFAWTAIVCKLRQEVATWPRPGAQAGLQRTHVGGACGARAVSARAVGAVRGSEGCEGGEGGEGGGGGGGGEGAEGGGGGYFLFSFL